MLKRYISLCTIAMAALLSSCGEEGKKTTEAFPESAKNTTNIIKLSQEQFASSGMILGNLEEKNVPTTITTNGIIDVPPENKAVVTASMGGYIKKTPLLIGDIVKKGQVLVTVENPKFIALQQAYLEIKEQLAYLKSEYDRQKQLMEENITSQKSLLKAESAYKTANAKYIGLQKQLAMLNIAPDGVAEGNISSVATILAPISGSITKMGVTKGTYVSPATSILEIIDNDHIHLELSVFEKDIMKVKKGQSIQFEIPEASEKRFDAEVYLVGTSIGENRTIKVHGHLMGTSENNFLTGMFVNAEIITEITPAMTLPSEALVTVDDTTYALLLVQKNDNELHFRQILVDAGITFAEFTVIKNVDRFKTSDQFLVRGAFALLGE